MSPLQIWNYLGLGRIGKSEFFELGGLKMILSKFFTAPSILFQHFALIDILKLKFLIISLETLAKTFLYHPAQTIHGRN